MGMFEPGFEKAANALIDRNVAESGAEGIQWARENPEASKTMEALRQYSLAHPEFQNKSPMVKRAIEAAILENQALQLKAGAIDYYNTSGLRNERDASKVQSALAEWTKNEIERSGLKNYEDKLLLAQHFMAPVRQMESALLAQHNQDVESQNVNLLFEQYSQKLDNTLLSQTNILNGGKNVNIPRDRATVNDVAVRTFQAFNKELTNLGVRDDQIMPFFQAQLLSGKFTASQAEAIGKAVTFDRNGEKVSLASQPGFAKALSRLKDDEMDRAWKGEVRGRQRAAWAREDAARNSANWGIKDAFNGKPLMLNLKERGLTNAMDIKAYQDAFNLASSVQFTSAYSTPGRAADALQFQYDLLTGAAGPAEVIAKASSGGMSPTEAQSFISIAAKNNSDEGRMLSAAMQDVAEVTLADTLNITRSEASRLMQQGIKDLPEHISAAREKAQAEAMNFYAAYEKEKAASGKDSYTALDITQLKQKHIASSSSTRGNKVVEERAAKKSGDLTRGIIMGVGKKISPNFMQPAGAGVDVQFPGVSPLTERDQKITHVYQSALNTLNTLFPDWKTREPDDPDALEKLHKDSSGNYRIDDLADMLMLGQGLYGKAFTADKAASIILGRVIPEDSMTKVQLQQAMEARITELNKLFRK
ncbi:hypothetical protein [Desulfovibrio sp. 6_1_46AFAA]|uniref:hypothetical protein n=1 Tax=Desulfovibrio sp. 6_1_46AFAA TaxID=665942 RepID=UPI0012EB0530|nr:hypothetical protein [Desulfovibrio sp. 6_1_46AFAA]